MANQSRAGGTFGHEIDEAKLARYKELAAGAPEEVRYYMNQLIEMVEVFKKTGPSKLPGTPNPATQNARTLDGRKIPQSLIVPLEEEEIRRIYDYVPYPKELDVISKVFDELPTGIRQTGEIEKIPLPPTPEKPNNFFPKPKTEVVDPKAKELRDAAFNLRWWAGQLCLDREPLTHQALWSQ